MSINERMNRYLGRWPQEGSLEGLILTDNVIISSQLVHLLSSACSWQMHVVHDDRAAFAYLSKIHMHAFIADIDASTLGGLATLIYAKRHHSTVETYAITDNNDPYLKQLASDMAGCRDFFYLTKGKLTIDMYSGFPAQLTNSIPDMRKPRYHPSN